MADSVTVTNFPDSGSRERVAYDLCTLILRNNEGGYKAKRVLDLYAECHRAAGGFRKVEGG